MMTISSKDQMRLRMASARAERWKLSCLKPVKAKDAGRGAGTVFTFGQDKPALGYDGKDIILSDSIKVRSSADKFARELKLDGGDKYHGKEGEYDPPSKVLCGDGKPYVPVRHVAKPHSPFKKAGPKADFVVVVKKKK